MIGSLQPDSGRVELFGLNISRVNNEQLDEVRKRFYPLSKRGVVQLDDCWRKREPAVARTYRSR